MQRVDGQESVRVSEGMRRLADGRMLAMSELPVSDDYDQFAVLVPAFDADERARVEAAVDALLDRGCLAFVCVGPEAEVLEDGIDAIIEARGAFEVVTTSHAGVADAVEFFALCAGGRAANLVALVDGHPEVVAALEAITTAA
ncbi:MAG: hypothetical protein K8W52_23730 [Deltaproteobacteria bacterium]|nr:hypothetical protein [Deltaproteobacteria bacterium]